jgi:basic membrane protein A
MTKRLFWLLTLLVVLTMVAACGGGGGQPATPAGEAPAAEEAPAGEAGAERYGQVTDTGGIDDKGFNQLAWMGLQQARDELGVDVQFLESRSDADYAKNIGEFISQGYNGVITVGFLIADATLAAAQANPDIPFAIVDFPSQADNIQAWSFPQTSLPLWPVTWRQV